MTQIQASEKGWQQQGSWYQDVDLGITDLISTSKRLVFWALLVFVAWATFVPLASAIVAFGQVTAAGQNQVIQHQNGGVIRDIRVKEGAHVKKGEILYVLDPLVNQAELATLLAQQARLMAVKQRLTAEKGEGGGELRLGNQAMELRLTDANSDRGALLDEEVKAVFAEQEREFVEGRAAMNAEIEGFQERLEIMKKRRAGYDERIAVNLRQLDMAEDKLARMRRLERNGHVAKNMVWDIESEVLSRRGEEAELATLRSSIDNEIAETQSQIKLIRSRDARDTSDELTKILSELSQIDDKLRAARSQLSDTQIKAPVDGVLVHPVLHNLGAVVPPGKVIAEIVPSTASLEMRARVSPADIARVHLDQEADIKVSALNPREFDSLPGKVTYVSADSAMDEQTGQVYFEVSVKLLDIPSNENGNDILTPGMVGEVYLKGESRTFASYLMAPISESFTRAFSEH